MEAALRDVRASTAGIARRLFLVTRSYRCVGGGNLHAVKIWVACEGAEATCLTALS